jgi:hypothetical protein
MQEALREYLQLRQRLTELDARESECTCNSSEFHCCDLCREASELQCRVDVIMRLWAQHFAVALAIHEGVMLEVFAE